MNVLVPQELVNQLVLTLATAIFAVLVTLISKGLHSLNAYLLGKIGPDQLAWAKSFADTIVRSLEQNPAYVNWDPSQKKEAAILQMVEFLNKNGISISHETIDKLIEEAVQRMKAETADI